MKSEQDIEADLLKMVNDHYYSEDYELEWSSKHYAEALSEDERDLLDQVLIRKLTSDPNLAYVTIVTRLERPALTPYLATLLEKEPHSTAMSRSLLTALTHQPDEQAFSAVERFMDSDQEGEALTCLARMNFDRVLPHLRWAMQKDHLHNFCLHILHEYMRHKGLEALLHKVQELTQPERERLVPHLRKILTSKRGEFNPFADAELDALLAVLI